MEEKGNLMKHITEMTSLAEQLREMKEEVSTKKYAIVILGRLPESYDNFLTSMNARNADDLDWVNVKGLLVEEYMKRQDKEKHRVDDEALFSRYDNQNHHRGGGSSRGGGYGGGGRSRGGGSGSTRRGGGHHGRFNHHPYNSNSNNNRFNNCNL